MNSFEPPAGASPGGPTSATNLRPRPGSGPFKDEPDNSTGQAGFLEKGMIALVQTTGGIVMMLLLVQFLTGVLLAFYYVPSADHAHTTVSFIEKVLPAGPWIRSLHTRGSQWLPLFLFLHIVHLFWRRAYKNAVAHWIAAAIMLALVMAAGATGYSLPWDARAFFSTRVAEGILAGIPLIGSTARAWMLGGSEISTLTISRFFALHVLVTPFLILVVIAWRFSTLNLSTVFDRPGAGGRRVCLPNLCRHAIAAGVVFLVLAIVSRKFSAPLGPSASSLTTDYLPRPGAQFLWLYQTLKYVPGSLGSVIAFVSPGLVILVLVLLPWLDLSLLKRISNQPQRLIAGVILASCALLVVTMTTVSYVSDRRDPRTRQQLAKQAADEEAFRREPFVATPMKLDSQDNAAQSVTPTRSQVGPPAAYTKLCATCHGEHGEGARQGPLRFPPLVGVSSKPRRTVDDIVGLLNDPTAYGLEPPMKSFATKLIDQEKRQIAEWVVTLKKN
jgi:ubiquinol-cytochrome c reductase cytochrome b subunit